MAATASGATAGAGGGAYQQHMAEAIKRFTRSIELCDDYLRGYYGLKLVSGFMKGVGSGVLTAAKVTTRLLKDPATKSTKQTDEDEFTLPDVRTIERLNELATAKLAEIVRRNTAKEEGWRGYDEREVAAAQELLSQDVAASGIER